jgi:hypothetical protein
MHKRLLTLFSGGAATDTTPPTVTITCTQTGPTATSPLNITFTMSEDTSDFAIGDITVGNGTAGNFAGSGLSYTCDVTPAANGAVTVDVAANAFHDAAGNGNTAATQFSIIYIAFTIRDDFTDTVSAGSVNGTNATPTGGTRTATDANAKLSVGSGALNFVTGGVGAGNPGLWYSQITRVAGLTIIAKGNNSSGGGVEAGFDTDQSGAIRNSGNSTSLNTSNAVRPGFAALDVSGAVYVYGTEYYLATILRATGSLHFIKGGAFTNWTFLYSSVSGTGNVYPGIVAVSNNTIAAIDFIRVPVDTVAIAPLVSDAFTRANGALGNTDGGGSSESGGSGLAWTAQLGTWAIATNKATCSAVDGTAAVGIATAPSAKTDVQVEAVCTRTAGVTGIVVRYADASNYVIAYHDGTNIKMDKVVGGVTTNLISAAVTYAATARIIVSALGTKFRLYYGDSQRGAEQTVSDTGLQTGTAHGLYTTDTGATFDNFVVFAKGSGGEYAALDKYINP